MGFWEFMTVAVVFGSVFGYLSVRSVAGKKRVKGLKAVEARVAELEKEQRLNELAQRVDVIEQIVVGDDLGLQRRIDAADAASRGARLEAVAQPLRERALEDA